MAFLDLHMASPDGIELFATDASLAMEPHNTHYSDQ
jgi:hypothetical protein